MPESRVSRRNSGEGSARAPEDGTFALRVLRMLPQAHQGFLFHETYRQPHGCLTCEVATALEQGATNADEVAVAIDGAQTYSITSSAVASSVGGTERPSAFAVS